MPEVLTIQPSDMDNYLSKGVPDTNYGSGIHIYVRSLTNADYRMILKFDFSALPDGAVISAATLSIYYNYTSTDPVGRTYWAYEITQTGWTELGSTWNKYDGTNNWDTAGGDYTTGNGASIVMPAGYGWVDWNVLALVQHFQSAHAKIANFLIRDNIENSSGGQMARFWSNNYTSDLSLRPKLVITYAIPQTYEESLSLPSNSIIQQVRGLTFEKSISLGGSAGISEARSMTLNPSLNLPASGVISEARSMTLNPSLNLPASIEMLEAGGMILNLSLSLPASIEMLEAGGMILNLSLSLPASIEMLEEGGFIYNAILSLMGIAEISEEEAWRSFWTKIASKDQLFYSVGIFDITSFDRCVFGGASPSPSTFWTKRASASVGWD